MAGQNTAVFGIFKASSAANKAVSRLTSAGFSNSDVFLEDSISGRWLSDMGAPNNDVKRQLKEGSNLVTVYCSNSLEVDRANVILEQNGAESIFSAGERLGTLAD
jgi:hypothetical protein